MKTKPIAFATTFILLHVALVAGFVPMADILPVSLGALALSSMALALVLAARWRVVDRLMGGPDKSYALHRYLGFFALFGMLGHWVLASSVGVGIVLILAEIGEGAGTVAAIGLLAMTGAAIIKVIPYHLWKASHMLMGPIFFVAAFHTFFTAGPIATGSVPWIVLLTLSGLGMLGWIQTLLRKRSPTRLVKVEKVSRFGGGVDVTLQADQPLPRFRPGQFSTLAYNTASAETHPFTIAGGNTSSRRFIIRAAGDWTDGFVSDIKPGDTLRLGRGEGRFLPKINADRPHQLWVAGGVGITPFLAAIEQMMPDAGAPVTLVYCIRSRTSAAGLVDIGRHAARLPQLDVIVLDDQQQQIVTPARLEDIIRVMPTNAYAYLCGPEGLKTQVNQAWQVAGIKSRVHSERFDFRGAYGATDLMYLGKPIVDTARTLLDRTKGQENHALAGTGR